MTTAVRPIELSRNIVLAFYGIDTSVGARRWLFNDCQSWWKEFCLTPTNAWLNGPGFPPKTVAFKTAARYISRFGFDDLKRFSIIVRAGRLHNIIHDTLCGCECDTVISFAMHEFCEQFASLESELVLGFLRRLIVALKPEYGIAFRMPPEHGPGFFASGISYGPTPDNISVFDSTRDKAVSRWGDVGMPNRVWNHGLVRDVFTLNILNEQQINRPIAGASLGEWISNDLTRGTISSVEDSPRPLWMWSIPDERLRDLHIQLQSFGLIF